MFICTIDSFLLMHINLWSALYFLHTISFIVGHLKKSTVHILIFQSVVLLYCLMENRSQELYLEVSERVKQLAPTSQPTQILSDFERALQNGIGTAWREAEIKRCYFHYCQVFFTILILFWNTTRIIWRISIWGLYTLRKELNLM